LSKNKKNPRRTRIHTEHWFRTVDSVDHVVNQGTVGSL